MATQALSVKEKGEKLLSLLEKNAIQQFQAWFNTQNSEKAQLLVQRYTHAVRAQMAKNPRLAECTIPSLYAGILRAAQCGLIPDGEMAALVPYNTKTGMLATFQPMIRGLVEQVYELSPRIKFVWSEIVYEKDEFHRVLGPFPEIRHTPPSKGLRGEPIGCYVVIRCDEDVVFSHYMSKEEIEAHAQAFSKAFADKHFWQHPVNKLAMWKKTVFRQMWTWIPKGMLALPDPEEGHSATTRLKKAISADNDEPDPDIEDSIPFEILAESRVVDDDPAEDDDAVEAEAQPVSNGQARREAAQRKPKAEPKKATADVEPPKENKPAAPPAEDAEEREDLLESIAKLAGAMSDETLAKFVMQTVPFSTSGALDELSIEELGEVKAALAARKK